MFKGLSEGSAATATAQMNITTKFDIGESPVIIDIGTKARITEIRVDGKNLYYRCQFWINGEIKSYELQEDELTYE